MLKPAFPEMVALRAQITKSQKQIQMQMELIKQTIKAEYEAAHAQELALIEKLEEVKTEVLEHVVTASSIPSSGAKPTPHAHFMMAFCNSIASLASSARSTRTIFDH